MTRNPRGSTILAAIQVCTLSIGLLVFAPARTIADQADCDRAASRYNAAVNNVGLALQRFSSCTASSGGRDNCSREFNRLKSADDDFEDAVSSYRSDCK